MAIKVSREEASGRSRCRSCSKKYDPKDKKIPKGEQCIVIRTWGPKGSVELFLCTKHAQNLKLKLEELLKQ